MAHAEIPNYRVVRPGLATGGKLSPDALDHLKTKGFKTVVDLRTEAEGTAAEKQAVEAQGLRYVSVPISAATFSAADVAAVAKVLNDPAAAPVLLHCASANRVGAVWAVLQVQQGRSLEEAEAAGQEIGLTARPWWKRCGGWSRACPADNGPVPVNPESIGGVWGRRAPWPWYPPFVSSGAPGPSGPTDSASIGLRPRQGGENPLNYPFGVPSADLLHATKTLRNVSPRLTCPGERHPRAAADEGYQVIVHVASPVTEASREDVSRFFLRQSAKWSRRQGVLPVDQSSRSAVREAFSRGVLRQPLPAVESYWRRQIASGRALPPPVKTSDAEVLAYVASTPGAVGYVSGGLNLTPGVKPLRLKE